VCDHVFESRQAALVHVGACQRDVRRLGCVGPIKVERPSSTRYGMDGVSVGSSPSITLPSRRKASSAAWSAVVGAPGQAVVVGGGGCESRLRRPQFATRADGQYASVGHGGGRLLDGGIVDCCPTAMVASCGSRLQPGLLQFEQARAVLGLVGVAVDCDSLPRLCVGEIPAGFERLERRAVLTSG